MLICPIHQTYFLEKKNLHHWRASVFSFETYGILALAHLQGFTIGDGPQVNDFINVINWMRWLLTTQRAMTKTLLITTAFEKFTIIICLCFIPLVMRVVRPLVLLTTSSSRSHSSPRAVRHSASIAKAVGRKRSQNLSRKGRLSLLWTELCPLEFID